MIFGNLPRLSMPHHLLVLWWLLSFCRLADLSSVIFCSPLSRSILATLLSLALSTHSLAAFQTYSYISHLDYLALLRVVTY